MTARQPIIVLEGPDAVGKMTWAREYCRQTGARYLHLVLRKKMYEHQVMSLALAARWSIETPVLIDRHWPSEQLYAAAYRGGSPISKEAKLLDRVMQTLGVTYVVCLLSSPARMFDALRRSRAERHEMYEFDQRYKDLVHAYYDWWHGTDYTSLDLGYCEGLRGFGQKRLLTSHLYNYETMGRSRRDLEMHVHDVDDLARDAVEESDHDLLCQDILEDQDLFFQELRIQPS